MDALFDKEKELLLLDEANIIDNILKQDTISMSMDSIGDLAAMEGILSSTVNAIKWVIEKVVAILKKIFNFVFGGFGSKSSGSSTAAKAAKEAEKLDDKIENIDEEIKEESGQNGSPNKLHELKVTKQIMSEKEKVLIEFEEIANKGLDSPEDFMVFKQKIIEILTKSDKKLLTEILSGKYTDKAARDLLEEIEYELNNCSIPSPAVLLKDHNSLNEKINKPLIKNYSERANALFEMSTLAKSGKLKQAAETIHDALKQNALTPGTVRYGKMTIEIATREFAGPEFKDVVIASAKNDVKIEIAKTTDVIKLIDMADTILETFNAYDEVAKTNERLTSLDKNALHLITLEDLDGLENLVKKILTASGLQLFLLTTATSALGEMTAVINTIYRFYGFIAVVVLTLKDIDKRTFDLIDEINTSK